MRVCRRSLLLFAALSLSAPAGAAPGKLGLAVRVTSDGGVINDAFALDDSGRTLAWIDTLADGGVRMHVGPAEGGPSRTIELTDFTVSPERVHFVGGQWFVVASEGERRTAAVVTGSKLATRIGPFSDGVVASQGGKRFVTFTERPGTDGQTFTIAAYRPSGGLIAQKQLSVSAAGEITGSPGLALIGFMNGYLQALVKKPGGYDRRADARGPVQVAVYDVLTGHAGPGKVPSDLSPVLDLAAKRKEQPGATRFVRRTEEGTLELVGPAERVQRLATSEWLAGFEPARIPQQAMGERLVFSLIRDAARDARETGKAGIRALVFFEVASTGRLVELGQVALKEDDDVVWSAGGNRFAVLRRAQANAGSAIEVYQR
jgi:hypothetical protein